MSRFGFWTVDPRGLWRVETGEGTAWARGPAELGPEALLETNTSLDQVLAAPVDTLEALLSGGAAGPIPADARVLMPLQSQEVWAAGVTFERSRSARNEEARGVDYYDLVYDAERPELFYKAGPGQSRGLREPIGIRADSGWDVPEPELGLVVNADGVIVGYTVANDVSSRRIEGQNPLYLPQAKVYRGSCAVGPCIVPACDAPALEDLEIRMLVERGNWIIYSDTVALSTIRRKPAELVDWLYRELDFPNGVVLLTGTSIVPPVDFTLAAGDTVTIEIEGVGELRNTVEVIDTATRRPAAG